MNLVNSSPIQQGRLTLKSNFSFFAGSNQILPDWIFIRNSFTDSPNLSSVLNCFIVAAKIVGLAFYLSFDQSRWLYFLMGVDICLNLLSWWLLANLRHKLGDKRLTGNRGIHIREAISVGLKSIAVLVLFSAEEPQVLTMKFALFTIVVIFLLILLLSQTRNYKIMFNSVFNFCNFIGVTLLFGEQIFDSWMCWEALQLCLTFLQWFSIAAFVNYFSVVIVLLCLQVIKTRSLSQITPYTAHIAASFRYLVTFLLYRSLSSRLEGTQDRRIENMTVVLGSVGYYLIYTCIEIVYADDLETFSRENFQVEMSPKVKQRKQRDVRLIRRSSTYFIQKRSGPPSVQGTLDLLHSDKGQASEEAHKCLVCCISEVNCISLSCMHAGTCSTCLAKSCGAAKRCIICRQDLTKLAIISRIAENEYKVEKEIRLVESSPKVRDSPIA